MFFFGLNFTGESGGGPANFTVDLWQTFEFATVNDSNLEANDNHASADWTVSGAPTTNTSANHATTSNFNAAPDTGTRGMLFHNDDSPSLLLDLGVAPTTQSVGFWWKNTLSSNTFSIFHALTETGFNADYIARLRHENNAGTNTLLIQGATDSSTVAISADTWYWITVKFVQSGTCRLQVFNEAGALVGSEVTCDGNGSTPFYHRIGTSSTSGAGDVNIDNFVVDYTSAVFPLGP